MSSNFNNSVKELAAKYDLSSLEIRILERAGNIISSKMRTTAFNALTSPKKTKDFARLYFSITHSYHEREVCSVAYLDNQNNVIKTEDLFFGTIDGASVYPRVIVQKALKNNAAAIILVHNHPSGDVTPSQADINITKRIRAAVDLVDIRLLDHIIVSGDKTCSMAEEGLCFF